MDVIDELPSSVPAQPERSEVAPLVGLHPIVLVTIFATGIDPASLGISPLFLALLLLGSWGISNPVSPASAVNNLLSGLL
jgi:hypothetical protein